MCLFSRACYVSVKTAIRNNRRTKAINFILLRYLRTTRMPAISAFAYILNCVHSPMLLANGCSPGSVATVA